VNLGEAELEGRRREFIGSKMEIDLYFTNKERKIFFLKYKLIF